MTIRIHWECRECGQDESVETETDAPGFFLEVPPGPCGGWVGHERTHNERRCESTLFKLAGLEIDI